jgi:glycosyltransferase involved in cell wall biosynthesis
MRPMPRSLHILITDPHLRGGGQVRYVTNLARELSQRGHRVVIGCRPGSVLVQSAVEAGCACFPSFAFRGGLRPAAWWRDVQAMRGYLRRERPDIVHVSGSQDHWTAAIANETLRGPACIVRTRHNTYTVSNSLPNRWLNRRATTFQIVVCDVVRRDLAATPVFDAARMRTIHNGVDAALFVPDPAARAAARAEFGYDDTHFVCGVAARLVKDKGHEFLLRAAAEVVKEHPQLRILLLGQGVLEDSLRALCAELGISGIVHFAGFRDDMARVTQAFDAGVLTSIGCDTSSFSLKEEMAEEKPIIASDYGGLTEIVDDGAEGWIVPAGEVAPVARALRELLAYTPEARARIGQAARARVLREFTVQAFAERTEAAYLLALEVHRDRPAS